jgi:uncharacterized small protein (DUF1192 family)/YHS domain-containing protein
MAEVKFADHNSFNFGEKSKVKKQTHIKDGIPGVTFYFSNGEMRTFEVPEDLVAKAAAHGVSQKIGDAFAGVDSVEDCILAFDEMVDRLAKGEWNAEREVGASASGASVLARAIAEFSGKPIEEVKAKLSTLSPKAKVQMRSNASLRPIIDRLEAERTKKGDPVDTDAVLALF